MNLDTSKITILSLRNSRMLSRKLSKNSSILGSEEESDLIIPSIKNKGLNPFINLKKFSTQRNPKMKIARSQSSYILKHKIKKIFDESPVQKEFKQKKFYLAKKYINYNIVKKPDDIYKIYEPFVTNYKNIVKKFCNDILNDKKTINNGEFYRNNISNDSRLRTKQIDYCPLKNSYINNINNNSCIAFRDMFIDQNKKAISKNESVYCLKKIKRKHFRKYNIKQKNGSSIDKILRKNESNSSKKVKIKLLEKDSYDDKNLNNNKINGGEIKIKSRNMGTNVNFDEINKRKFVYHNNVKMKTFFDLSQYKKKE